MIGRGGIGLLFLKWPPSQDSFSFFLFSHWWSHAGPVLGFFGALGRLLAQVTHLTSQPGSRQQQDLLPPLSANSHACQPPSPELPLAWVTYLACLPGSRGGWWWEPFHPQQFPAPSSHFLCLPTLLTQQQWGDRWDSPSKASAISNHLSRLCGCTGPDQTAKTDKLIWRKKGHRIRHVLYAL